MVNKVEIERFNIDDSISNIDESTFLTNSFGNKVTLMTNTNTSIKYIIDPDTHIKDPFGEIPPLKNNDNIIFYDIKNKKHNGKIKSTNNNGFADVIEGNKKYLCIYRNRWEEYNPKKKK